MKMHILKTLNPFFNDVWEGKKNFEIRKNDRNFQLGDTVQLLETDKDGQPISNRIILATIYYILDASQFGLKEGYVALSLNSIQKLFHS